jgi:flagellar biosynthesis/type III secretory pathway protein FliH
MATGKAVKRGGWCGPAAVALIVAAAGACSMGQMSPSVNVALPSSVEVWQQRLSGIEEKVETAKQQYEQAQSYEALQAYEDTARRSLEEGFALFREHRKKRSVAADEQVLVDVAASLNTLANDFIDVAEAYVKRHNEAAGSALAAEFITRYTDLPLLAASLRAETLLFETRYRRDF